VKAQFKRRLAPVPGFFCTAGSIAATRIVTCSVVWTATADKEVNRKE